MERTARYDMPLLAVAQAAKEMTVNEALVRLDMAVQPVVQGITNSPPMAPGVGQGWLVGGAPNGAFADHAEDIVVWTTGGWRFLTPFEGMAVWRSDIGTVARWSGGQWIGGAAIATVTGGSVIDIEARAAIETIVARLRLGGLIAD